MKIPMIRPVLMAVALTIPGLPSAVSGGPDPPAKKLKIVVFGGHPDDPESGAGGLVAMLTRRGHEVILAYGTAFRGDRRFFDRPEAEVRRAEATAACKVLGAEPKFFPYAHERLVADEPTLKAVSAWLDEVKPDVVVTHWPLDTHPNHHAVSSLVWRCYKPKGGWNLYFFEVMTDRQTIAFRPELYLDIGPVREVKKRALMEHRSQEPESIWEAHEMMHRRRGSECGVTFAEAYSLVEPKEGCPLLPVPFLKQAAEPHVHRDIPYAGTRNQRQTLDVYAPPDGKDHPIVFWIHGGGWQVGDKRDVQAKPRAFVDKGFVFVSTNYRLLPEATIKEMAGDVAKAIRWVHDHARQDGGDPETIFVMGHSAGAQLAALICTDHRYLKAEGLSPSVLKGCVPVDGDTYDVPMQIATVEARRAGIYRRKFGDEPSQKDLSPVTHITKGKGIPPFLILHVADHPETRAQSQRLARVLQAMGVSARAFPAAGKDHGSINADLGTPGDEPTKALFEFLEGALRK